MVRVVKRKGMSLAEVCVAVLLFTLVGGALIALLTSGAKGAARGGEHELAAAMAARVLDGALSEGYAALDARAGLKAAFDLNALPVDADGIVYSASWDIARLRAGLLRLTVDLTWVRPGAPRDQGCHDLSLTRYVADPHTAELSREEL